MLVLLSILVVTACTSGPPATPTPAAGGQPVVAIESPANNSFVPVGQPLVVRARAIDTIGVTRLDLRVNDILVDSESTPGSAPQTTFVADLEWRPTADQRVTLSVIAYRSDGTASDPTTITVAVVLDAPSPDPFSPAPTVEPTPTEEPGEPTPSPTPGVTPTAAARPTLPPFATPTPSPTPTPTPSPTPIAIDIETYLDAAALPNLQVGVEVPLQVFAKNNGPAPVPATTIRLRLCNTSGNCGGGDVNVTVNVQALNPDDVVHYFVNVTPQIAGMRELRARIAVPDGYVDNNPGDNVWEEIVPVDPAATPTPSP